MPVTSIYTCGVFGCSTGLCVLWPCGISCWLRFSVPPYFHVLNLSNISRSQFWQAIQWLLQLLSAFLCPRFSFIFIYSVSLYPHKICPVISLTNTARARLTVDLSLSFQLMRSCYSRGDLCALLVFDLVFGTLKVLSISWAFRII